MAGQQSLDRSERSRTQRFLRYILRRKPCYVILLIELIIAAILMFLLLLVIKWIKNEKSFLLKIKENNAEVDEGVSHLSFFKCQYGPLWTKASELDDNLCMTSTANNAASFFMQPVLSNDTTCLDRFYTVPCHQAIPPKLIEQLRHDRLKPRSCGGTLQMAMPFDLITSENDIYAPQISNSNLKKYLHKYIYAPDLFVKCPRCRVSSGWYKFKSKAGYCRRQLATLKLGWPDMVKTCGISEQKKINLQENVYC